MYRKPRFHGADLPVDRLLGVGVRRLNCPPSAVWLCGLLLGRSRAERFAEAPVRLRQDKCLHLPVLMSRRKLEGGETVGWLDESDFKFGCPRCGKVTYHNAGFGGLLGNPKSSDYLYVVQQLGIVRCETPVTQSGCGYQFGVDPSALYCRCTCGRVSQWTAQELEKGPLYRCECSQIFYVDSSARSSVRFRCDRSGYEHFHLAEVGEGSLQTACGLFTPHDIARLSVPNFAGRLETAVLPRAHRPDAIAMIRDLVSRYSGGSSAIDEFRSGSFGLRRATYRRVIVTAAGLLAEEVIFES